MNVSLVVDLINSSDKFEAKLQKKSLVRSQCQDWTFFRISNFDK